MKFYAGYLDSAFNQLSARFTLPPCLSHYAIILEKIENFKVDTQSFKLNIQDQKLFTGFCIRDHWLLFMSIGGLYTHNVSVSPTIGHRYETYRMLA